MIKNLQKLFQAEEPEKQRYGVELAAAALLMEIIFADYKRDDREMEAARQALRSAFLLSDETLDELLSDAESLHQESVSAHPFLQIINDECSERQKYELLTNLWRVAMADGHLDRFEQHYIRKISELLYIPHSDFIRAKLQVIEKE